MGSCVGVKGECVPVCDMSLLCWSRSFVSEVGDNIVELAFGDRRRG